LTSAARQPRLRQALASPLRSIDVELARPYYSFDRGVTSTRVVALEQGQAWIHQLGATAPGAPVHGVIVERYA
jgi:hypothetical protein